MTKTYGSMTAQESFDLGVQLTETKYDQALTLYKSWKTLTQEMLGSRAGGVKWLALNVRRSKVLADYADLMCQGNQRAAVLALIE